VYEGPLRLISVSETSKNGFVLMAALIIAYLSVAGAISLGDLCGGIYAGTKMTFLSRSFSLASSARTSGVARFPGGCLTPWSS